MLRYCFCLVFGISFLRSCFCFSCCFQMLSNPAGGHATDFWVYIVLSQAAPSSSEVVFGETTFQAGFQDKPASQSASQSACQPACQPVGHPSRQPANQSASQPLIKSLVRMSIRHLTCGLAANASGSRRHGRDRRFGLELYHALQGSSWRHALRDASLKCMT